MVTGSRRPLSTRLIAANRCAGMPLLRSAAATADRHSRPWAVDVGAIGWPRPGPQTPSTSATARHKRHLGALIEAKP